MTMDKAEIQRALDLAPVHAEFDDIDPALVVYEESGWRVKDILAHLATWDAETLRALHAHRRGGAYSIPGYTDADDFNAYAASMRMDEPLALIYDGWEATRRWLRVIVGALTPDDLSAEMTYPSGRRGTVGALIEEIFSHQAEHLDHIRTVLKQQNPLDGTSIED